jgi:hypothetical protein
MGHVVSTGPVVCGVGGGSNFLGLQAMIVSLARRLEDGRQMIAMSYSPCNYYNCSLGVALQRVRQDVIPNYLRPLWRLQGPRTFSSLWSLSVPGKSGTIASTDLSTLYL